ncbi:ABC transporter permease [uncultured Thiocystis sp.]|jgi:capsular polysaccharide transport system permease protein|uniref:ABC transporter permease n=1 Tax=uncultured Thiocystis sp. TaxID=1202134 RepID=UPI0025DC97CB|nr:ABC transporter permease [uncultured Thiocystis sp.]
MRSHWQVTWSVWHALFMREVLARTTGDRLGWFWMLGEPVAFIVIMVGIRSLIGRTGGIIGADYIPWLIVGITAFFLFRESVIRAINAIEANQALFAYRQVKPIDPVLVRSALEGLLKTTVLMILMAMSTLLDYDMLPADPLGAMLVWLSMWLLGLGGGLVVSVGARLVPDIGHVIKMLMLPMFIMSGAIFPIQSIPHAFQRYLLYNPVLHGLELLRADFFTGYTAVQGVSFEYLWHWNLALLALGLALHLRFAARLKAK